MFIACSSCHRQFDVTDLKIGDKIRCLCGELLEVEEREPLEMQMLRCASCGGQLESGAKACGFCGSEVSLAERGYGGSCPECFARMPKGASFCCTCGVAIRPTAKLQPLHDKPCPRCKTGTLAVEEFEDGSIVECTACGGVWLEESVFETLSREREQHAVSKHVATRARRPHEDGDREAPDFDSKIEYLKCPTCAQFMHRKNFANASGVIIDWCSGHGFWFDRNELERIIKFIAEGGLESARDKDLDRRESTLRRDRARVETRKSEIDAVGMGRTSGHGITLVDGLISFLHVLF
jgi:Zn-finger nucleic acid-binding protein